MPRVDQLGHRVDMIPGTFFDAPSTPVYLVTFVGTWSRGHHESFAASLCRSATGNISPS